MSIRPRRGRSDTESSAPEDIQMALLGELQSGHHRNGTADDNLGVGDDAMSDTASTAGGSSNADEDANSDQMEFDQLEEFDFKTAEDHVMEISSNVFVPSPYSMQTKTKTRVAQAGYIVERLHENQYIYDENMFDLCKKYHSMHRKKHDVLKKRHRRDIELRHLSSLDKRDRWNYVFDQPQSTRTGRILAAVEFLFILVTLVQLNLETMPQFNPEIVDKWAKLWFGLEFAITMFFTVESIVRFLLARNRIAWIKNPLNILDVVAVLPFYLGLVASGSAFDFLKVLRMARFVKLFRSFRHIDSLVVTLSKIAASLIAPFAFLGVSVLIISNLVYFAEGGNYKALPSDHFKNVSIRCPTTPAPSPDFVLNPTSSPYDRNASADCTELVTIISPEVAYRSMNSTERRQLPFQKFLIEDCECTSSAAFHLGNRECPEKESQFVSAIQAVWFSIVSMTTVGYGDFVVQCAPGRVIMSCGLFLSTVFLAMPIAIVGNSFTETVQEKRLMELRKKQATAKNIKQMRLLEAGMERRDKVDSPKKRKKKKRKKRRYDEGEDLSIPSQLMGVASSIEKKVKAQMETTKNFVMNAGINDEEKQRTADQKVAEQHNRERMRLSQETVTSTAGEALLMHLACVLQQRYFSFRDFNTAVEKSDALASIRTGLQDDKLENPIGSAAPKSPEEEEQEQAAGTVEASSNNRKGLPAEVVHHIDTWVSNLLEQWLSDWLADQAKDLTNPQAIQRYKQQQRKYRHKENVDNILDAMEQRLITYRDVLENLQPMEWFNKLQSVDNRRGFANEVHISRLITYDIVALPKDSGKKATGTTPKATSSKNRKNFNEEREKEEGTINDKDNRGSVNEVFANRSPLPGGFTQANNTINLYCRELVLPQQLARIEIHYGFVKRSIRLVPMCPSATQIHINGEPLEVVAANQAGAAGITIPPAQVLNPGSWDHVATAGNEAFTLPLIDEQTLTVFLKDGDLINFTPVVKLRSDYDAKSSSSRLKSEISRQHLMPTDDNPASLLELQKRAYTERLKELRKMGVDEIVYKVVAPPELNLSDDPTLLDHQGDAPLTRIRYDGSGGNVNLRGRSRERLGATGGGGGGVNTIDGMTSRYSTAQSSYQSSRSVPTSSSASSIPDVPRRTFSQVSTGSSQPTPSRAGSMSRRPSDQYQHARPSIQL